MFDFTAGDALVLRGAVSLGALAGRFGAALDEVAVAVVEAG